MPSFEYRAKDAAGKVVTGTLVAESQREVLFSLDKQGLFPLEVKGGREERVELRQSGRKIRPSDVISLTRELADLLKAGLGIDRALALIAKHMPNRRLSDVVDALHKDVSQGSMLHEAMAKHPAVFPKFYVSMVLAAETGGFLEEALQRIALFAEKDEELRSRIRTALAYPILLIVIGAAAVIFLLVFFIPRFATIFQEFGSSLPLITQVLISTSEGLQRYGLLIAAGLGGAFFAFRGWARRPAGEWALASFALKVPVLGELVLRRAIARFARTLGTMLKSGVPILDSMRIAKESMGSIVLMREVDEAAMGVKRGDKLGQALSRSNYVPALVSSTILVGEESGNLENVLLQIADSHEVQVDRAVKIFVSLFEPLLLVFMAAVVGLIVIAMLLPVFTLSTIVK
jgi:type II secretory pathway component PulF